MPFNPKDNQLFHLILCSNYEAGVNRTKNAYASKTLNPIYRPDNKLAYKKFISLHPETIKKIKGRRKPIVWKVLWKAIKGHEDGICDCYCRDFKEDHPSPRFIHMALEWLKKRGYLGYFDIENAWGSELDRYIVNWDIVGQKLGVYPPPGLYPLSPEDFNKTDMGKFLELIKNWKQSIAKKLNQNQK